MIAGIRMINLLGRRKSLTLVLFMCSGLAGCANMSNVEDRSITVEDIPVKTVAEPLLVRRPEFNEFEIQVREMDERIKQIEQAVQALDRPLPEPAQQISTKANSTSSYREDIPAYQLQPSAASRSVKMGSSSEASARRCRRITNYAFEVRAPFDQALNVLKHRAASFGGNWVSISKFSHIYEAKDGSKSMSDLTLSSGTKRSIATITYDISAEIFDCP